MILYALNELNKDQLTAEVRSVGGHQTHGVFAAGCGEMTHCSPLVLFRVVQEHLVSKDVCLHVIVVIIPATCRSYHYDGTILSSTHRLP